MGRIGRAWRRSGVSLLAWAVLVPASAQLQTEPDIPLTAAQSAELEAAGWPTRLPEPRTPDQDFVQRRNGSPVLGELASLHAFAVVAKPTGETLIAREDIGLILLDGKFIPPGAPLLPLDEDAVVLADGRAVLAGRVETEGDSIYVAGRTLRQADVAFIRLLDPTVADREAQAAAEAQTGGPASTGGGGGAGGAGAPGGGAAGGGPAASGRPVGPGEIPWGEAVWRGNVRFESVTSAGGDIKTTESGNYAITFKERLVGTPELLAGVDLGIEFLAYRYTREKTATNNCPAYTINAQGVGFDRGVPEDAGLASKSMLQLPIGSFMNDAGRYLFVIISPAYSDTDACNMEHLSAPGGWPLVTLSMSPAPGAVEAGHICDSTAATAPPPYTTIDGETVCGTPGEYGYASLDWHFDRGVPGADPTIEQDPCAAPRALRDHAQDRRTDALDRLKQIQQEFAALAQREATQRNTKDQLEPAFKAMLYAALAADLGMRLLELATSEGVLKAAAASGRITAAQQQFISRLDDAIELFQEWQEFADDPGAWGSSKILGGATELEGPDSQTIEYGDYMAGMAGYAQLFGEVVGQGDGSATLAYIESNLASFGPLIPEYSINKARQYVEASQAWANTMREMSRLAAEAGKLAFDAEELGLEVAVRDSRLDDC